MYLVLCMAVTGEHLEDQGVDGRMGSEWILGRLAWGVCGGSVGSGQGPVAGFCEYGDEHFGFGSAELVWLSLLPRVITTQRRGILLMASK
jgi:hypothetical protein